MRAVVKLGGAMFRRDPVSTLEKIARELAEFALKNENRIVLVAGGGENARAYISAARRLGAEESTCDLLGIQITKANAELVRIALDKFLPASTSTSLSQTVELSRNNRAVVMGGLQPGQSTNAVAALAAEITRSDFLVNATDVEGVYTSDPKKDPKARLLRSVQVEKLLEMAMTGEVFAGRHELLDPLAVKIIQRSKIPTRFVSLSDPTTITHALEGKDVGTLVSHGQKKK